MKSTIAETTKTPKRVVVIGAGVTGLCTSLELAKRGHSVTVVSEKFSSFWDMGLWSDEVKIGMNLVSDVAAASFIPHSDYSPQLFEWLSYSSDFYLELYLSFVYSGVVLYPGIEYVPKERSQQAPWYSSLVFDMKPYIGSNITSTSSSQETAVDHQFGWSFTTFLVEPRYFIPFLKQQLQHFGVKFIQKHISDFQELAEYDVIVNCSAMGSQKLANDTLLKEVIGEVLICRQSGVNSGLKRWMRDTSTPGDISYVYPQRNTCVLGGTKAMEPAKDKQQLEQDLKSKCSKLAPEISQSVVIGLNMGKRPSRPQMRVEIDETWSKKASHGKASILIHNYGQGGEGYCFAPGCANHVAKLVSKHFDLEETKQQLFKLIPPYRQSKL